MTKGFVHTRLEQLVTTTSPQAAASSTIHTAAKLPRHSLFSSKAILA
jgi:hypothetical protein